MTRLTLATICGLGFGAVAVAIMLPMQFPNKRAAIAAAFVERFGVGFVIGTVDVPWPGWAAGLFFGLLLSAPSAIITKAWGPIMGLGAIGGTAIGMIVEHFSKGAVVS